MTTTKERNKPNREALEKAMKLWYLENPYIPHNPTVKQARFLLDVGKEALYGGAAGGGKSDALLMAALAFVKIPEYSAILFRRTYADLALSGALMDRAHDWLQGTDAHWSDKTKTWTFPSGATVAFGYLEHENTKYRYQGAEFQFIGFDELTQFTLSQYTYLFSRLRRNKSMRVPLRMRSASNPGGIGHEWVKQRFLVEDRKFIPATIDDNPHLDRKEYVQSLKELDPVTRQQLLQGSWDARQKGNKFDRSWFEIVDSYPQKARLVRYWDLAATEPKKGKDPDYTAGCLMAEQDGIFYIVDMRKARLRPQGVESLIGQTAAMDGKPVDIYMEQEGGSSGVNTIDHYTRRVLKGYSFRGHKTTGSKEVRANPVSSTAEAGNIKLVRGPWISDFLNEVEAFPTEGVHDDQVDAMSGAFTMLNNKSRADIF